MKPPTVKTPDTDLLNKLADTNAGSLRDGIAKVEGITQHDEESHGRWLKSVKKRIINKLTSWFLHFLFVVVCIVVLFVVIGTIWLTYLWVASFIDKPAEVGAFLRTLWEYGLIALATLFIQNIWPKE